jgi:hypothetical protein
MSSCSVRLLLIIRDSDVNPATRPLPSTTERTRIAEKGSGLSYGLSKDAR